MKELFSVPDIEVWVYMESTGVCDTRQGPYDCDGKGTWRATLNPFYNNLHLRANIARIWMDFADQRAMRYDIGFQSLVDTPESHPHSTLCQSSK